MIRNMSGISKKEKNHPQASDGSFRQDHQFFSVPTSTVNIVTQNVTKSNRERIVELIYLILKAGSVINSVNSKDTVSIVRATIKKWITDR